MIDPHAAGSDELADPAWTRPARSFPPAGTPDAPDFDNGGAWPWDWSGLSRAQAQRLWDRLEGFVAYLNARYAWDFPHQIPMCWAFHGALVEELTTLYWSRWAAFSGPDANPDKTQAWHTYFLPSFYTRLASWCGGAQHLAKCQAGEHVPAKRKDAREGSTERWARLTAELRETDEDDRLAESIGFAQSAPDADPYPPLSLVEQADPGPPNYGGPEPTQ